MRRMTTALSVAATVILMTAANAAVADVPKEVRDWLKFFEGIWDVTVKSNDNNAAQPGIDTSELAAGGIVLITKGKVIGTGDEFVSVQAWEPEKKKLVVNWYNADGTHARSELDATTTELKGNIVGTDNEGATFTGTEIIKRIDDNTTETTFDGALRGKAMKFTLISKRKK